MQSEVLGFPLFAGDPAVLADKLRNSTGLLGRYWKEYQESFLTNPETRASLLFLPALVSGDHIEEACGNLRQYYRNLARNETSGGTQFHTWCVAGEVTRWAAFFDWLAWRGAWSVADIDEAAECFLGFAFKHAYMTLLGRGRGSNNQVLGMTLNCAVVGYLFGRKLAQHPTGVFLYDYAMARLPDLLGLFPADGYGGEGSTYTSHVNTPLIYWTAEFLRDVTGRDALDTAFPPNGSTMRRMLDMEMRITSPGGLQAPWDHYGWMPAINASPFAYLAKTTGNPRYLALIPSLKLWSDKGFLAWGCDDPLWTLLWWPGEFKDYANCDLPAELFGWFLPRTGAALDDPKRRARLMQVWDESAETLAGVSRAQVNPNHLMFEIAGEPVFQDGFVGDKDPWGFKANQVLATLDLQEREQLLNYYRSVDPVRGLDTLLRFVSPGLIGAANVIVVDEEPWYWPGGPRVGKPEHYSNIDGLQTVMADCAAFYQPHYDVQVARRTSIWSDKGFGVVLDTLKAKSSHTWRWQVHLRPETTLEGDSACITLPSGRRVMLAWQGVSQVRLEMVEGFPQTHEKRSCRLELLAKGAEAAFTVLIVPDAHSASIRRVDAGRVEAVIDGREHSLNVPVRVNIEPPRQDVHTLSDIGLEHEASLVDMRATSLLRDAGGKEGEGWLPMVDACLAQLAVVPPDEDALIAALSHPLWPVQVAAAEVLGRYGCAAPILRERLRVEHAVPAAELYPPEGATGDAAVKRWRLKAALILALGRLHDREAVPLIGRILADGHDFYPVYSVAAQALGRIGGPEALTALAPALKDSEENTQLRAKAAQIAINMCKELTNHAG